MSVQHRVDGPALLHQVELTRLAAARRIDPADRSERGQFFTPVGVASLMASMAGAATQPYRVLDAGAGVGSLSAALYRSRRTIFLNSTLVDSYFRQFNGHTQVNATDLRSLRYPPRAALIRLGQLVLGAPALQQEAIDRLVEREVLRCSTC